MGNVAKQSIVDLQGSFSRSIRQASDQAPEQSLLDDIVEDGIPATERLNIHRNTMAITLKASLKSVFPVVDKLVGSDFFDMMATAFLEKSPPSSGVLIDWGVNFPAFVKSFTPAQMLPYLADVAALEWAWHESFHGKNSEPLKPEVLTQIPPEKMSLVSFSLAPSHTLISSPYPIVKIWESNVRGMGDEETINLDEGGDKVLVIRPELEVQVFKLDPGAFDVLGAMEKGKTLTQAYDDAVLLNPGFDLGQVLSFFIQNKFFTNFTF